MKFKLPLFFVIALLLQGVAQISLLNGAENKLNNSIKLHRDVISNASGSWQTVSLPYSYNSMVVICTVNYPSPDLNPVVPRVRNATGNSFELKIQDPGDLDPVAGYSVHYFVVEEGQYNEAEHGVNMEAVKFESSVTNFKSGWNGELRSYLNNYSNPVVLGQVMTANDPDWSVFWACGDTVGNPPSSTALKVGKHVGEDSDRIRTDETVGYVVIESGSGTLENTGYVAGVGADTIRGIDNGPPFNYNVDVLSSDIVVASAAAMDGNDGGWPILLGTNPSGNNQISLAFDEDRIADLERAHTTEQIAYLALRKTNLVEISVSASNPTASGFIFNYDVVNPNTPGGEVDVILYWGTTDGLNQASNWESNFSVPTAVSAGKYMEPISGLQANTIYYINASAENSDVISWATTSFFTTSPLSSSIVKPTVTADSVEITSTDSAKLPFSIIDTGGEDPMVSLSWLAEGSSLADTYNFDLRTFALGSYEHEIIGLEPATNYTFTVEATNSAGTSEESSNAFTTRTENLPSSGGTNWLTGAGAPNDQSGNDADLYLDTDSGDYYIKKDGSWGSPVGNLTGPRGETGPEGPAGASPFLLNGSDVYYTSGNVGIGTSTPAVALDVVGDVTVSGKLTVDDGAFLSTTHQGDIPAITYE